MLVIASVFVVLLSVSCAKKSPTEATGPNQQYPLTLTGTVSSQGFTQHSITAARSGTLTLRLTWSGANDLDLYLTTAACDSYPPGNQPGCPMLALSTADSGNTETITRTVSSGEEFKAWVDNFDTGSKAYGLSVDIQ